MRWSRLAQTIAALIVAGSTAAFGQPSNAAEVPSAVASRDEFIPMYLSDRRILVMLRSGGHPPAPVVFDTGTNGNDLDTDYANALGLPNQGPADVIDGATGDAVAAYKTTVPAASLAGVKLGSVSASVFKYDVPDEVGIFGPNNFAGRLVFLDFHQSRLRLTVKTEDSIPAGRFYAYVGKAGDTLPAIDVELPGATIHAVLDTGNDSDVLDLPTSLSKKLPLVGPLRKVGTARSASGEQPIYQGQLQGVVRIGPLILSNPIVHFDGQGENGNVGLHFIRQLSLVFDPEEGRTWVLQAPILTADALKAYAGRFGIRTLSVAGSTLIFQRDGQPAKPLVPVSEDLFKFQDSGILVRFHRRDGKVVRFEQILEDGSTIASERTG